VSCKLLFFLISWVLLFDIMEKDSNTGLGDSKI
jgi:hypothetical protein